MSLSPETSINIDDPVGVLQSVVDERHKDLQELIFDLTDALDIAEDHEELNRIIAGSPRPDLLLNDKVEMFKIAGPHDIGRLNNFTPRISTFGIRLYEDKEDYFTKEVKSEWIGYRSLDEEEKERAFLMGARGGYKQSVAFAADNEIDQEWAKDFIVQTHIHKESFMRMWIAFPDFTQRVIDNCLWTPGADRSGRMRQEEIYAAYEVMSRLVDRNDMYVIRDGEVDDWVLCR
jgi:hypothetical protein